MHQNEPSRIVMFSAEAAPFAKDGGMGDVVGALPKALGKLGLDPAVVIPAYRATLRGEQFEIRPCRTVAGFDVQMGDATERADIYQTRLRDAGVDVYLIGSGKYFDRAGIYNDPNSGEGYWDNAVRFLFFMKAGLELLPRLMRPVDILHCHDSHTALIPALVRLNYAGLPFYRRVGTLFTIHNLAYQGIYPKGVLHHAGIDPAHFYPMSPFEYWDKVNFMKAGILMADKVNTVSQTYAAEIMGSREFGHGLEGVLESRRMDVSGIVNGIDYEEWNPEKDPLIPANYSAGDLSGKAVCRDHLRRHFGLPRPAGRTPLVGMVSRLADQKGFDLVAEAAPQIAALGLQLVILGVGQRHYHETLRELALRHPGTIAVHLAFDNALAHLIEAGADMFLMPSRYEPCGLSQLVSLRYGTIPVVRATGGLADTVAPYTGEGGTGFLFREYSAGAMLGALRGALDAFADADSWQALVQRAMREDWSWNRSAESYRALYRSIHRGNHPEIGAASGVRSGGSHEGS